MQLSSSQIYDAFLVHFIGENPRFDSGVPPDATGRRLTRRTPPAARYRADSIRP